MFFYYMLAGMGLSTFFRMSSKSTVLTHSFRFYAALSIIMLSLMSGYLAGLILHEWPGAVTRSDSGMIAATKTYLSGISGDYVLVSAMTRGFVDLRKPPQMLDLIDLTLASGNAREGSEIAANRVRSALLQQRSVYYLSSHFEQGSDFQGGGGRDEFGLYFRRLNDEFDLAPVYVSDVYRTGDHLWILYRVQERAQSSVR
jgi:hypothetical protein